MSIQYFSTRGGDGPYPFADVLLAGTARDGGLFVPERIPTLSGDDLEQLRGASYRELACRVLREFAGDSIDETTINASVNAAMPRFRHRAVAPLKQLDADLWLLELFHGPTFAFKDYALQIVAELIERALHSSGERILVLCATSGDTGAAAAAAFAGRHQASICVLHPHERVSPVQRRQMTTLHDDNVLNLAVDGDFDRCQGIVKELFGSSALARYHPVAVNSINWARITAQIVYYGYASLRLGSATGAVDFVVPTGNFGNVLAGHYARTMGFPIGKLIMSSNENDVLPRLFETGVMQSCDAVATLSPSMDIQTSSNFERLLFELKGGDGEQVAACQQQLRDNGRYTLTDVELSQLRDGFDARRCDTASTLDVIRATVAECGEVLCPHTATAMAIAREMGPGARPMVVVATAHPAKFPQAISQALGAATSLPEPLEVLSQRQERYTRVDPRGPAVVEAIESALAMYRA